MPQHRRINTNDLQILQVIIAVLQLPSWELLSISLSTHEQLKIHEPPSIDSTNAHRLLLRQHFCRISLLSTEKNIRILRELHRTNEYKCVGAGYT